MKIIEMIWDFFTKVFTPVKKYEIITEVLYDSTNKGNTMKKIVDAISDERGNITFILLEGEETFISIKDAIERTKNGEIDALVITKTVEVEHLRTKADGIIENNLDYLAEKHK